MGEGSNVTVDRNIQPEDINSEMTGGTDEPISWDRDGEDGSNTAIDCESATADISAVSSEETIIAPVNTEDLEHLVEQVASDPGAPFTPEAVASLAKLRKENRAGFEVLRSRLKDAGCRVTALDEAIDDETGGFSDRAMKQADVLVGLAEEADLFHSPDRTGYADLMIEDHRETWPIRSKGFRHWLARRYYDVDGGAPGSTALQSALGVIEAKANFGAPQRVVYVRIGGVENTIYLDLCDKQWRAIEIDTTGWRVVSSPPVRFRRAPGMQPLPEPDAGGSIATLRSFLNIKSDADFVLVVSWILAALRNRGPYPVIALSGEQGSAKSTFSGLVRSVLDPNTAPLRALPREDRDLFIAANNGHVLAFDNVSGLPHWISDTLCRLATGGGFAVRQLYTDQDEILFQAARPVILNGIEDFVTRPDLADRSLFLTLSPIPERERRPEGELRAAFEAARPRILGVLLDAVVTGLNRLSQTRLEKLPRMADFALWAAACETAFWAAGTFEAAYRSNRDEAVDNVIDSDPIASAVRTMMATRPNWSGTASDLLVVLFRIAGEGVARSRSWPKTPRALAGKLRRAVTFLRKIGIEITFSREGHGRARTIHIAAIRAASESVDEGKPVAPAASSAPTAEPSQIPDNAASTPQPVASAADDLADGAQRSRTLIAGTNAPKNGSATGAYVADANFPTATPAANSPLPGWTKRI
jgi:hypothetical protein